MTRERKEIVASPACKYAAIRRQTGGHAACIYIQSGERKTGPESGRKNFTGRCLLKSVLRRKKDPCVLYLRGREASRGALASFSRVSERTPTDLKPESSVL